MNDFMEAIAFHRTERHEGEVEREPINIHRSLLFFRVLNHQGL